MKMKSVRQRPELETTMSKEPLPWDKDALKRVEKIPAFVRRAAKSKIERAAREAGETRVTSAFIEENRSKLMR